MYCYRDKKHAKKRTKVSLNEALSTKGMKRNYANGALNQVDLSSIAKNVRAPSQTGSQISKGRGNIDKFVEKCKPIRTNKPTLKIPKEISAPMSMSTIKSPRKSPRISRSKNKAQNSKTANKRAGPTTEPRIKFQTNLHELLVMKSMKYPDGDGRALKKTDESIENFTAETERKLFEKLDTSLHYTMEYRKLIKILEGNTLNLRENILNKTIDPTKLVELLCQNKLKMFLCGNENKSSSMNQTVKQKIHIIILVLCHFKWRVEI